MPALPAYNMLVPGPLLRYALQAMLGSQAALDNTTAVASLASAFTSLAKRAGQLIRAAAELQSQPAAAATGAADPEGQAAACFPAAALSIVGDCVTRPACLLTDWFESLETVAAGVGNTVGSSSSSSSSSPAAASAALLAVVFARSLVLLADAMEAAGQEVCLKSVLGRPSFGMRWMNEPAVGHDGVFSTHQNMALSREDQQHAEVHWQLWQLHVLHAMKHLWAALKSVGIATLAAAVGEPAAAAAASTIAAAGETLAGDACADPQEGIAGSSSGSSSNSNGIRAGQQLKWGYLLHLQQCSPQWAAAVAAYEASQPHWEEENAVVLPSTAAAAEQHSRQYAEAIGLCRALAAAAPLPIVCNNPSCGNTEGLSEAAAASKACAGCRCRYCSVACQKADWKRHKDACRRMAAAGQACS
jgi:hypothetical protein